METVCRENMCAVFEYKKAETDISWMIRHFIRNNDEVLYFVEGNFLKAVVSVGDVFHFLEGEALGGLLNTRFTCMTERNSDEAKVFFLKHPTIHELPLINSSGHFVGIVRSGKRNPEWLWKRFQYRIKSLWFDQRSYERSLSEKFMNSFEGTVFLIDLPYDLEVSERLHTDREKEDFKRKQMISPLEQLRKMLEQEERIYWGPAFESGISRQFVDEFLKIKVQEKNGCKYYADHASSQYITFDNGKRAVTNKSDAARKIYLAGPCTVFGAYVTDHQTIAYYLQKLMKDHGNAYQVVNFGSLGLQCEFQYLLTECLSDDDIVVIASPERKFISMLNGYSNTCYLGDYSDIFDSISDPLSCILDTFRHVNYKISQKFAERIYTSIKPYLTPEIPEFRYEAKKPVQDYFISWDIVAYYKEFAFIHHLNDLNGATGAIVMNCNPFTRGHRYLVEYASAKVDTLILFVVEEDASAFSFDDRMEMVRLGTADLVNVRVVPSGKYNISKSTFAQYFEKEKEISKIDSMEYDLRIFCEVIADCIGISCRFAGEEPADIVTAQYNETMKRILPQYGIAFIEIPWLKIKEAEYISASSVRRCLKQGDWEAAAAYLPETTVEYLKNAANAGK